LAQQKQPNIVVIMGDDVGIWNIGAYHRGMMAGRTPNIDKTANEGMLFTDYYAEGASCTAGRANFVTGELPIRTGMTTSARPVRRSAYRRKQQPSRRVEVDGLCHRSVR
jgi:arylsulfatase